MSKRKQDLDEDVFYVWAWGTRDSSWYSVRLSQREPVWVDKEPSVLCSWCGDSEAHWCTPNGCTLCIDEVATLLGEPIETLEQQFWPYGYPMKRLY